MAKFITQKGFIQYLKAAALNDTKYECNYAKCPLAKATGFSVTSGEYSPLPYPDVNDYISLIEGTVSKKTDWDGFGVAEKAWQKSATPLPSWAKRFIDVFDNVDVDDCNATVALFIMARLNKYEENDLRVMVEKEFWSK